MGVILAEKKALRNTLMAPYDVFIITTFSICEYICDTNDVVCFSEAARRATGAAGEH